MDSVLPSPLVALWGCGHQINQVSSTLSSDFVAVEELMTAFPTQETWPEGGGLLGKSSGLLQLVIRLWQALCWMAWARCSLRASCFGSALKQALLDQWWPSAKPALAGWLLIHGMALLSSFASPALCSARGERGSEEVVGARMRTRILHPIPPPPARDTASPGADPTAGPRGLNWAEQAALDAPCLAGSSLALPVTTWS